jgi:hypothetical protein
MWRDEPLNVHCVVMGSAACVSGLVNLELI